MLLLEKVGDGEVFWTRFLAPSAKRTWGRRLRVEGDIHQSWERANTLAQLLSGRRLKEGETIVSGTDIRDWVLDCIGLILPGPLFERANGIVFRKLLFTGEVVEMSIELEKVEKPRRKAPYRVVTCMVHDMTRTQNFFVFSGPVRIIQFC